MIRRFEVTLIHFQGLNLNLSSRPYLKSAIELFLTGTYLLENAITSETIRDTFMKLKYPMQTMFINKVVQSNEPNTLTQRNEKTVRIVIPFEDQKKSGNVVRKQLKHLSLKIGKVDVVPVFTSAKIEKALKHSEVKPVVVSN